MIAYRSQVFTKIADRTVFYDDSEVRRDEAEEALRRGAGFLPRNIGLLVALERVPSKETIVFATTHLFWHPKYTYERARYVLHCSPDMMTLYYP